MYYTLEEIRARVDNAVAAYNASVSHEAAIRKVTLFGSYAEGSQNEDSDVDLLVSFNSPVVSLFTLARVLEAMESSFAIPVDVVQDPLPVDALLEIRERVPLYEAA